MPLKPNCFWTIIHCKFPHGVGGGGVMLLSVFYHCICLYLCRCHDFNPNLYRFSPISPTLCHCFKANKEIASNKKTFCQYCFAELILSLSDMLTDFTNKIEHSFSVSVLTCMWHAKCLQMVNHSVFQQELLINHSAPDGSKSPGGSWSVSPRAEFFKAGLMRDLNSDLKASKAFQF